MTAKTAMTVEMEKAVQPALKRIRALDDRITANADHVAKELGGMTKEIHGLGEVAASEWREAMEKIQLIESRPENEERFGLIYHRLERLEDGVATITNDKDQLEALIKASLKPPVPTKSKIYTALCKAQAEIENAQQNKEMTSDKYSFKYADLASVLDAVRGPLSKNGIALFQTTEDTGNNELGIRTVLAHGESGQTIQDLITMNPPRNDPQGVGSCRTYMRRYAILALCGIAGAEDDDAERTKKDPNDYPRISVSEVEKIIYHADELFAEHADEAVRLMLDRVFGSVAAVGDIREGEFDVAITHLDRTKEARDKREAAAVKKEAAAKAEADEK